MVPVTVEEAEKDGIPKGVDVRCGGVRIVEK